MREDERQVRVLLSVGGKLRKLAWFVANKRDASFYIIPFSLNGKFIGGEFSLGNGIGPFETKVDISSFPESKGTNLPHLSLHRSGSVRAYVNEGDTFFGELQAKPIGMLVNQHIATLGLESFEALPVFEGTPDLDSNKNKHDAVIEMKEEENSDRVLNPRFLVIANSLNVPFMQPCGVEVSVGQVSPLLDKKGSFFLLPPIRYCVSYRVDKDILWERKDLRNGVYVLAGWNVDEIDKGEQTKALILKSG